MDELINQLQTTWSNVDQALAGNRSVDDLTGYEQELWFDEFSKRMGKVTPEEERYYANLVK